MTMPAAKHFDPLLGVDIHIIQPPGPVPPLPIPHPFVGMVIDPMEYAPYIGGTVKVNGMMRAVAGTGGKCLPPHIPIGGVFVKPPANEAEMFMGSQTVDFDGDPASYMALPALSCHDVGMPSPPRLKKHSKPKSLELPTTVVLPIPAGPPVLIGGPPTINIAGMLMKVGLKGLGKAFKKLKASKLGQKFAAMVKKAKQKVFKNMKPGKLKCDILKAEPVNSITGEVIVEQQDFNLLGPIPLEWNRTYGSQSERPGLCGYGWQTPADARLVFETDGTVTFADGGLGSTTFASRPVNGTVEDDVDGIMLIDKAGNLSVRTKAGLTYLFARPKPGATETLVETIRDRLNNPIHFVRDGADLRSINDNTGRRIEVKCRQGRIEEMALHHPDEAKPRVLIRYEYNTTGDLVTAFDALNAPYRFVYHNHCLVKHTDRKGLSFSYEYNQPTSKGRCLHTFGDGGLYDYRFEYDDALQETRITDSLGHKSTIQFDERFLPINEIDALGGTTSYEYDDGGRTTAVKDPAGNETKYEYDERGNVLAIARPDGSVVAFEYNADSQIVKITDPNGGVWKQKWDMRGLLSEQTSPLGGVSKYEYDAQGRLLTFADPRGSRTILSPDAFGNTRVLADALGNRTEFAYDALGNVTRKIDPLGRTIDYQYDSKARLVKVTMPSSATIQVAYDAEDNLTRYVDQNGAETRLDYFGLGELAKRTQPDGHTVQYHYDTEERLIGITNQRSETYRLVRDKVGRIVEEIDYWGQARKYEYNGGGHLLAAVDPLGRRIDYATDPLGRVLKKLLPGKVEETFEYDGAGNMIGTKNAHGEVKRIFNAEGQLVKETHGDDFVIENRLDLAGNRVERKTSLGNTVQYTYDRLDQVSTVQINDGEPIRMERDGAGQITRETLAPGIARRFGYNADGRITEQSVTTKEGPLFSTRFEYDRIGNLTKRDDTRFGIDTYKYDPMGRILEHLDPQGKTERLLNDPAGDRLRTKISRAGDQWSRDGEYEGAAYRFDRAGNLIERRDSERNLELVWDANQRLIESRNHGNVTRYGYDPLGRRVFKETDGVRTRFFWDGDFFVGESIVDIKKPDIPAPVREYVYYPTSFKPLAMLVSDDAGQHVHNYHNDPNGCPTRLTSQTGQLKWSASYSAWGKSANRTQSSIDNHIRSQGQYEDEETGLFYNRYRYFDSVIGQFATQDPTGLYAGENIYALGPNIFRWTDPFGLSCSPVKPNSVPVPEGHTRAYRAVSEGEYQDILASGQLRQGPNSMEGKWFSDSLDGAQAHGRGLFPDGKFRLVEADIPDNVPSLFKSPNLDQLGPSRYVDNVDLPSVVPRPLL